MLKSGAIEALQRSIELHGDTAICYRQFLEIVFPESIREYDARETIVRNIIKAKRDLGEPMSSDFFRDIWPKALKAMNG